MLSMVSTLQGTPGLTLGESRGAIRLLVLLSLRYLLMRSVRRQEQALCLSAQTYHERGFASSASFCAFPSVWPEDCEEKARLCHALHRVPATSSPAEIPQVLQRSRLALPGDACLPLVLPGDGGWSRAWGRVSCLYLQEPAGHPIRSLSFEVRLPVV